jgi:polar amino acid transport system substrate-binding protein
MLPPLLRLLRIVRYVAQSTVSRCAPCALYAFAALVAPVQVLAIEVPAIEVLTEENPPFNFQDHQGIGGISTEIVKEMGRRAGVAMSIHWTSWVRAYQGAIKNPNTCVYSTVRLPEREALFKWVGPIATNKWALFAKGDFGKPINTIDDARPFRIGGVIQDANIMYLQSLGFTHLDLVGEDYLNLNKLAGGRIDLWITPYYKGMELIKRSGLTNIHQILMVREVDYYLACNPRTSDDELNALSRALHTLNAEGFVKSTLDRYAGWFNYGSN